MRVLITGITGFVGSHLAEFLLAQKEVEVFGTLRWRSKTDNIDHLKNRVRMFECDLRDAASVYQVIGEVRPDRIFHLAGQSFVPMSWKAPSETMTTNAVGQINLLESIREFKLNTRIQIAGSSEEYGLVSESELPLVETSPLRPLSPYAVSKVAQDLLGYQYARSYKMFIVRTRAFNHCVSKWTPILIRDGRSGLVDIRYISELRRYKPTGYMGGQQIEDGTIAWDLRRHPIEIWCVDHWAKAKELSCHSIRDGKLHRIFTKSSMVEVTGSHSVLGDEGQPRTVSDLKIGDKLQLGQFPKEEKMWVHPEVAWVMGLFVAEGCVTIGKVRIDNTEPVLLRRAQEILLRHFGQDSYFANSANSVERLAIRKPEKFAAWLAPQIYASDHNKRVPQSILNAQQEAKLAFLDGYNEGDGLKKGYGCDKFKNFKTKSPILAAGLHLLVANTTQQEICLNRELRGDRIYYSLNLNSSIPEHKNWGSHLALIDGVVKLTEEVPYSEEVWDISTEEGWFSAGIGQLVAHNTGPRRGEVFATSNFAKQIASIEAGLQEPVIRVGNLDSRRDFTDVRDIIRGYWLALEKGEFGEVYNLCSEKAVSIREMLNLLLSKTSKKISIQPDPARMRPSDVMILLGSCAKFRNRTGWKPEIPFDRTLEDLLNYWREKVRAVPASVA
jgi:GDP-D-mannose dehydratase